MTIELLLQYADTKPALAVRPVNAGRPGKVLWIDQLLFGDILAIKPKEGFRFDDWIADKSVEFDVDDSAIHHNVNTPEAWEVARTQLPTSKKDAFGDG